MVTPRHAIGAGIVLLALAVILATGGHGFWILFALFWFVGPRSCHGRRRWDRDVDLRHDELHHVHLHRDDIRPDDVPRDPVPDDRPVEPDPTRDRHEAFPGSR